MRVRASGSAYAGAQATVVSCESRYIERARQSRRLLFNLMCSAFQPYFLP